MTANQMIKLYEERYWPIIVIYNQFRKSDVIANFFRNFAAIEGSEGGRIDPRILIHDGLFFSKTKSSALTNPDLSEYLKKMVIGHVVICGVYAEGCVRWTPLEAQRANLRTTLISDGGSVQPDIQVQMGTFTYAKKRNPNYVS